MDKPIQEAFKKLDTLNIKHTQLINQFSLSEQKKAELSQQILETEKKITQHLKKLKSHPVVNLQSIQAQLDTATKTVVVGERIQQSLQKALENLQQTKKQTIQDAVESQREYVEEQHRVILAGLQTQLEVMTAKRKDIKCRTDEARSIQLSLHEKMSLFEKNIAQLKKDKNHIEHELQASYQNLCQRYALVVDQSVLEYTLRYTTNFEVLHGTYWRMAMIALEEKNLFKAYQYLSFMNKSHARYYDIGDLLQDVQNQLIASFEFEHLSPLSFYQKAKRYQQHPDIVIALCILSISLDRDYRFYLPAYQLLVETLIAKDAWFEADIFLNRILNFDGLADKSKFLGQVSKKFSAIINKIHSGVWQAIDDRSDASREDLEAYRLEMLEVFKKKITACQDELLLQKITKTRFYLENHAQLHSLTRTIASPNVLMEYVNNFDSKNIKSDVLNDFPDAPSYLKAWVHFLHQDFDALMQEIPYFKEIPMTEIANHCLGAGQ